MGRNRKPVPPLHGFDKSNHYTPLQFPPRIVGGKCLDLLNRVDSNDTSRAFFGADAAAFAVVVVTFQFAKATR